MSPSVVSSGRRHALGFGLAFHLALAWAAPGAHGPNGEHLDAPGTAAAVGSAAPRFEAKSEDYEIVGRLQGGELSLFINRYASNAPVDGARVEVALGPLKAQAPFHADQGDYAVADEALLRALAAPGEHALLITLADGPDADLLEGTLSVPSSTHEDAHAHGMDGSLLRASGLLAAVALAGLAGWWLGSRHATRKAAKGGL